MSKETLEEYIKEVTKNFSDEMSIKFTSGGIKLGAKWQAERMYSEEEMRTAISIAYSKGLAKPNSGRLSDIPNVQNDIFQQSKKK